MRYLTLFRLNIQAAILYFIGKKMYCLQYTQCITLHLSALCWKDCLSGPMIG